VNSVAQPEFKIAAKLIDYRGLFFLISEIKPVIYEHEHFFKINRPTMLLKVSFHFSAIQSITEIGL